MIDLHGSTVGVTWTHLDSTASADSNTIKLKESVIWPLNSQIIIATTGNKFSIGQSESRNIISKSADNKTLTLDKPLEFEHLSEKRTVGSGTKTIDLYLRAEVGLLSRNVIFQGYNDESWAPLLTSVGCSDKFNPGFYFFS